MDSNHKVIFSDNVISQEVSGEMVLLDLGSENYFGLDSVGTDIWKLLQEGKTLQQAQEALCQMYEVEPDQLRHDMQVFVENLVDSGLASLA